MTLCQASLLRPSSATRTVAREHRHDVRVEKTRSSEIGELIGDFNTI
jgi:hypothetical protein